MDFYTMERNFYHLILVYMGFKIMEYSSVSIFIKQKYTKSTISYELAKFYRFKIFKIQCICLVFLKDPHKNHCQINTRHD